MIPLVSSPGRGWLHRVPAGLLVAEVGDMWAWRLALTVLAGLALLAWGLLLWVVREVVLALLR